jgi:SEL1 protein
MLVEDDGPWYMGKAREEFNRRMRDAAAPGDDEDPVQVRKHLSAPPIPILN